jgi:PTH1 family peptidyl-tRNA hydrolase
VMRGISDGIGQLIDGHGDKFLNAIALRAAPPRSSTTKPGKAPASAPASSPAPSEAAPQEDTRSALERLKDRFR